MYGFGCLLKAEKTESEQMFTYKNELLKNTRSKLHGNYYGFRKAGRETNPLHPEKFMQLVDNLMNIADVGSHFYAHWILKGITVFGPNLKNNRK